MKKFLVIAGLFLTSLGASAQQSLGERNIQINGSLDLFVGSFNALSVGLDYGVSEDATVGANLSLTVPAGYIVTANGNYHFNRILELPEEYDFYAGASLGFYSIGNISNLILGPQIGGRYFFNEKWGVNVEIVGSLFLNGSSAKLGVTYKL